MFHLDFLLSNPDVMIHYGFSKKTVSSSWSDANIPPKDLLALNYFDFVGIDRSRIISGPVVAGRVILPREGGCQDASYNAWELWTSRRRLKEIAFSKLSDGRATNASSRSSGDDANIPTADNADKPLNIIILHRTISKYSQNLFDTKRRWKKETLLAIVSAIEIAMPESHVDIFSDGDSALMSCISCQIQMFSTADVVIGVW